MTFEPAIARNRIIRGHVIWLFVTIKETLKALDCFKTKQKSLCSKVFWFVQVGNQYTIHWDKTQIFKKFPLRKLNDTKNALVFFRGLQLIERWAEHYMSWSTRFVSLKLRVGFSNLDSVSFLLNFIIFFNKIHGLFDFKMS